MDTDSSDQKYFEGDGVDLERHQIPTFEEFARVTKVNSVSYELYVVEGDLPIRSRAELRIYYDQKVTGKQRKSAVHTLGSGADDKWYNNEQLGLRYCVSDDFGAGQANMIAGMNGATLAWRQVANVWYVYDNSQDASCGLSDPVPAGFDFKVSPWTDTFACAFFPGGGGCVDRTVVYTLANAATDALPGIIQVLTHELGHTLGFAHENQRSDWATGSCIDPSMRFLTGIDTSSIMSAGPPGCGLAFGTTISPLDGIGLRALYGIPAAWHANLLL